MFSLSESAYMQTLDYIGRALRSLRIANQICLEQADEEAGKGMSWLANDMRAATTNLEIAINLLEIAQKLLREGIEHEELSTT